LRSHLGTDAAGKEVVRNYQINSFAGPENPQGIFGIHCSENYVSGSLKQCFPNGESAGFVIYA